MKVYRYKHSRIRGRIGWAYAEKDGRAVLICEMSWRKINGIWINTKSTGSVWILFRRTQRYDWSKRAR